MIIKKTNFQFSINNVQADMYLGLEKITFSRPYCYFLKKSNKNLNYLAPETKQTKNIYNFEAKCENKVDRSVKFSCKIQSMKPSF